MKKTRSDSLLDSLRKNQQEQLEQWLLDENVSLEDTRARLAERFGIQITLGPISRFAKKCRRIREFQNFHDQLEDYQNELRHGPQYSAELFTELFRRRALELATAESATTRDLTSLMQVLVQSQFAALRQQEAELEKERFQLEKAERELKLKQDSEEPMSWEEREARFSAFMKQFLKSTAPQPQPMTRLQSVVAKIREDREKGRRDAAMNPDTESGSNRGEE